MPKKQIIIPHYCTHCNHLSFVHREGNPFQFQLLDYIDGDWNPHSCAQIQPEMVDKLSAQDEYNDLNWDALTIPFQLQGKDTSKKRQPLAMGVVLNAKQTNDNLSVEVITPENQILNVRILNPSRPLTAGKAINLKRAVRVGKGNTGWKSLISSVQEKSQPPRPKNRTPSTRSF